MDVSCYNKIKLNYGRYKAMTKLFGRILAALLCLVMLIPVQANAATELAITKEPKSVKVLEGETAKVTVEAQGDGLKYAWYYKNPGDSSYTKTSTYKSNYYSITMNESRSGRYVYCKVTDKYGNTVKSKTVSLKMAEPVTITQQPKSVRVADGETASVTVIAEGDGLTYEWYYKNPGASKYSKTSSFKGNTYSITMNEARDGRYVYCKITDKYGVTVKSNTVSLRMMTPLEITRQPEDVMVGPEETAEVTLEAQGDKLTYVWYYKNAGDTKFRRTDSFTGPSYSITMTAARDGRQVYCRVKDQYGNSVKSNTVTLSMGNSITDFEWTRLEDGTLEVKKYIGTKPNVVIPGKVIGKAVVSIAGSAFGHNDTITSVRIPDSVTAIGDFAFSTCTELTKVEIPDTVTTIGRGAFLRCGKLADVQLPASLREAGSGIFESCTSLTEMAIPDGMTYVPESIFNVCTSLKTVTIPESVVTIERGAFSRCESLTGVVLPSGLKSIGQYAFSHCESITELLLPQDLETIDRNAFAQCTGLKEMAVPNSVTTLGAYAFFNCTGLESVTLPNSITEIQNNTFTFCESLRSFTVPSGVTTIGSTAFAYCTSLASFEIPASVTTLKSNIFDECPTLATIVVPPTVTTLVDYVFGYGKTTVVLCTEGSAAHTWCKNYHQPFELI